MSKIGLCRAWRCLLIAGLTALGAAAPPARNAAPTPSEHPIAVVADAAAAQAALGQAQAAGQALITDLTLGHEGQLVRANSAAPLAPGRYRLHALVACAAQDPALAEGVALRLVAGGRQGVFAPKPWVTAQDKLAAAQLDFVVDKPGPIPVIADWIVRDDPAKRQNIINQMNLKIGPDSGLSAPAPDIAGLGDAMDDLEVKAAPRLAPRALAGPGLPPHRLMLTGLLLERLSPVLKVRFAGRECAVRYTPVAAVAGFDLAQAGEVEIECQGALQSVELRPTALGLRPAVTGNKITLPLSAPAYLSLVINGDLKEPLFLFADPPEQDAPKPGTPGVRYFAAGKVHEVGKVTVTSGETVYLERGAVVRGSFFMDEVRNVKIFGRGILDGGVFKPATARMIEISRAEDVVVEGITIMDSKHWTVPILCSDRVTVRRVKIVSGNPWDDGVVVLGSRDVTIEHCFIRTKDSCVAIKAGGVTYFTQLDYQRDVENVAVRDCVLWHAESGHALEIHSQGWLPDWIGKPPNFAPRAANIRQIRFTNTDLIHGEGPGGAFTIHTGDQTTVSDVSYEDLRVEDSASVLVDFKIRQSPYRPHAQLGHISDIVFRNILVEGRVIPPSMLLGFDETHRIEGVVFENVQTRRRKWTQLTDGPIAAEFTTGVVFR